METRLTQASRGESMSVWPTRQPGYLRRMT